MKFLCSSRYKAGGFLDSNSNIKYNNSGYENYNEDFDESEEEIDKKRKVNNNRGRRGLSKSTERYMLHDSFTSLMLTNIFQLGNV